MNEKSFLEILNKCQQININDNIYYIWNNGIDRLLKFNKILSCNDKIEFELNQDTDIYFRQDEKFKILWCDYDKIWEKIDSENVSNQSTSELIKGWLKKETKWMQYSPWVSGLATTYLLKEDKKWNIFHKKSLSDSVNKTNNINYE